MYLLKDFRCVGADRSALPTHLVNMPRVFPEDNNTTSTFHNRSTFIPIESVIPPLSLCCLVQTDHIGHSFSCPILVQHQDASKVIGFVWRSMQQIAVLRRSEDYVRLHYCRQAKRDWWVFHCSGEYNLKQWWSANRQTLANFYKSSWNSCHAPAASSADFNDADIAPDFVRCSSRSSRIGKFFSMARCPQDARPWIKTRLTVQDS